MRLLGVVQARVGSTRLPRKSLAPLWHEATLLDSVLARVALSVGYKNTVLAIPYGDTELASYWHQVVYGDEYDVLSRFAQVSLEYPEADTFVRFTADCPLLDPGVSRMVIDYHEGGITSTVPEMDGLDTEVFDRDILWDAHYNAVGPMREHVTKYMKVKHNTKYVSMPLLGTIRWSVDDEGGLDFVRRVYADCEGCRNGVPHHTNAVGSIGGSDGRSLVPDLHIGEGGGLVECTAEPILRERMGEWRNV